MSVANNSRRLLGIRISGRRMELKLTQIVLAKRVGIARPYLAMIERGFKNPSLQVLQKIEKELSVPPGSFSVSKEVLEAVSLDMSLTWSLLSEHKALDLEKIRKSWEVMRDYCLSGTEK
jgi:transcriptional regulator with XRE-family HTH domain